MTAKVIRFPSRVTGAMRLPDPLDYPNEGEVVVFQPRTEPKSDPIMPVALLFCFAFWGAVFLTLSKL